MSNLTIIVKKFVKNKLIEFKKKNLFIFILIIPMQQQMKI